jgi:hypothetical protein
MPCVHLKQLFQLCQDHEIKLASSDLIHIVCTQCDEKEVCPSVLTDEYDASHPEVDRQPVDTKPSSI